MDLLYDVAGSDRVLLNHPPKGIPGTGCKPSYWMCFGLWQESVTTFPEACNALTRHVGMLADLTTKDRVLEVGSGAGDGLRVWLQDFHVQHVTGVEVVKTQQELAARRLQSWLQQQPVHNIGTQTDTQEHSQSVTGMNSQSAEVKQLHSKEQIQTASVIHGSATQLSVVAGSMDAVVAVDCAYHFNTRQQFFQEAARVLRTEGRLVMVDAVWDPGRLKSYWVRWLFKLFARLFLVPSSNHGTQQDLACQLQSAGFVDIHVQDITQLVVPGFVSYVRRRGATHRKTAAEESTAVQYSAETGQAQPDSESRYINIEQRHGHQHIAFHQTSSKQHPLRKMYEEVMLYFRWQKFDIVASLLELLTCTWKCVQYVEVTARKPLVAVPARKVDRVTQ